MNVQSLPPMTIDRFFAWYETQERKYELVGGIPRMQPYVKHNHSTIAVNLTALLWQALDRSRYHIATSDFGVETGNDRLRFPDVVVFRADTPPGARLACGPVLVSEILSESTQHIDFGEKQREYVALESLDTYLVLAQDKKYVWQWTRDEAGNWPDNPALLDGPEAILTLERFGIAIPLSAIYAGVN